MDPPASALQVHSRPPVELFKDNPAAENFLDTVSTLATLPSAFPMAEPEIQLAVFGSHAGLSVGK
jgi:hypothetical protein